ncbi:hypothetical protein D3C81_484440 [compost metagenome]
MTLIAFMRGVNDPHLSFNGFCPAPFMEDAGFFLVFFTQAREIAGAGLPAMVVNDNACDLDERGALESIACRLAPTGSRDA